MKNSRVAGGFCLNTTIEHLHFNFGAFNSSVHITHKLPGIAEIASNFTGDFGSGFFKPLLICDRNTRYLAEKIMGDANVPLCIVEPGEAQKNWQNVEYILRCARDAGLGRDGTFIAVGGGLIGDLGAFAASIYMRGCSLALVSTTLLGMVDASVGGKTGFNLFGIKNLTGTFYPARHVYISTESLASLPAPEWKSGMAELIKTAILDGDAFLEELEHLCSCGSWLEHFETAILLRCISRAVQVKGGIVQEDPQETGTRRMLLNLGHTFGHALESAAGLGNISHGEAVAWGIARACELGIALDICPRQRAQRIQALLTAYGYTITAPHPLMGSTGSFMRALGSDKKERGGKLHFIVPDEKSARPVVLESDNNYVKNIITSETIT